MLGALERLTSRPTPTTTPQLSTSRHATPAVFFDITPMTKHRISGPDSLDLMNRLVTRDVSKIKPGRIGYTVWCNDDGQVIDDGTIFHLEEGVYRLCSQDPQIDWLQTSAIGFDVDIIEETHDVAAVALQGPTSCATLKKMGLEGIENMTPFGMNTFEFEGTKLLVSRTGYTGDLGYELWIDPEHALVMWGPAIRGRGVTRNSGPWIRRTGHPAHRGRLHSRRNRFFCLLSRP